MSRVLIKQNSSSPDNSTRSTFSVDKYGTKLLSSLPPWLCCFPVAEAYVRVFRHDRVCRHEEGHVVNSVRSDRHQEVPGRQQQAVDVYSQHRGVDGVAQRVDVVAQRPGMTRLFRFGGVHVHARWWMEGGGRNLQSLTWPSKRADIMRLQQEAGPHPVVTVSVPGYRFPPPGLGRAADRYVCSTARSSTIPAVPIWSKRVSKRVRAYC